MESQSSKGDPSKSPVSCGGKGDPSKSPMSDSGKGNPSKSPISDGGKGDPGKTTKPQMLPVTRRCGLGTRGRRVSLLTNHFKVSWTQPDDFFYHYNVHASPSQFQFLKLIFVAAPFDSLF
jgi:hypothetical protein